MKALSLRALYTYSFVICSALVGFAIYLQENLGLHACPLCVIQRFVFLALAMLFFIGMINRSKSKGWVISFNSLVFLVTIPGLLSAGRQIWLQYFVGFSGEACSPSLAYMLENIPLKDILGMLLHASGDCGEIQWTFLGGSIPVWTFVFYTLFAIMAVINMGRFKRI